MNILIKRIILPFAIMLPWDPEDAEPLFDINLDGEENRYTVTVVPQAGQISVYSPDKKQGLAIPLSLVIGYGPVSEVIPHGTIINPENGRSFRH